MRHAREFSVAALAIAFAVMLALPGAESANKQPNGQPCSKKGPNAECASNACVSYRDKGLLCIGFAPNGKGCDTAFDCLSLRCQAGKCVGLKRNEVCDLYDIEGNLNPQDGQCAKGRCAAQKDDTGLCKDAADTPNGGACRYGIDCASELCATLPDQTKLGDKGVCWGFGATGDKCKSKYDCVSLICTAGKCEGRPNGDMCDGINKDQKPEPQNGQCRSGFCKVVGSAEQGVCTAK